MQFEMKKFGLRIAKLRIAHGYTQERLSDALNVDRTHISKIEAGTRSCSIDLLVQFQALFGVKLDYLVHGILEDADRERNIEDIDVAISLMLRVRGRQ